MGNQKYTSSHDCRIGSHSTDGSEGRPFVINGASDPYEELTTPAVFIDLDIMERNIENMAAQLAASGISHRPHIKSHKSVAIASKQLAAGAVGITTAKLAEAEVFAAAGFTNILLAYPVIGADKLERFQRLHEQMEMIVTVDSMQGAEGLAEVGSNIGKPIRILIEVDGGLHRGGRQPGYDTLQFALELQQMNGLSIQGLMGYYGTIYQQTEAAGFAAAIRNEAAEMAETAALLRASGIPVDIVSSGSTPAALYSDLMEEVTEVRAGNYVFFDASGVGMGLAEESDCALRVAVTIVSTPLPGRATIDAGTKTLTSDKAHHREGFGIIIGRPEIAITGLNEEHGFLSYDPDTTELQIGDRLEIIPNHSCVLPNLCTQVAGMRGGKLVEWIKVDAQGCNY